MEKHFRLAATALVFLGSWSWALNKNQSVEFTQTQNRNASTDVDAVFHNPAGVAFLPSNGLYLAAGNQLIFQNPSVKEDNVFLNAFGPGTYQGEVSIWLLPTLHAAYRMDDLSFFLHAAPLSGGGKGVYDQGLPMFDNMILGFASGVGDNVKNLVDAGYEQQLAQAGFPGQHVTTGSQIAGFEYQRDMSFTGDVKTYSATAGAAYKILPTLSASLGYRFAYASNTYKGGAKKNQLAVIYQGSQGLDAAGISGPSVDTTINATAKHVIDSLWRDIDVDVTQTGVTHGVVVGLDFQPDENLNFGLRFEWNGDLELENTESSVKGPDALVAVLNQTYGKGVKSKATEPMVIAGGIAVKPTPKLTLESSLTYGLASMVDLDGAEKDYHDSYYGGLGVRYKVTDKFEAALGYTYDGTSRDNPARTEITADLPTQYLSTGFGFQASPRLRFDIGAMVGLGQERHGTSVASGKTLTFDADHLGFGFGLEWSPAFRAPKVKTSNEPAYFAPEPKAEPASVETPASAPAETPAADNPAPAEEAPPAAPAP